MKRRLKICMVEACKKQDKGSIGAFYVRHHAEQAGFQVDVKDAPAAGYDVELMSVHHCSDFPRLAAMPQRAPIRIVGGHPMQNNPRPVIPYADVVCVGEGERWIGDALRRLEYGGGAEELSGITGTIVSSMWHPGAPVPKPNIERPLPYNPPYLNRPGTRSAAWYIEMARGCPYRCEFCELGSSTPYRMYSREHLEKVIDAADTRVTRKINFYAPDEASHPHYNDLYSHLSQKGFSAAFSSMRIDSVMKTPPIIKSNHLIRVGVDGLTEKTRKRIRKNITDNQIVEYFRMFLDRGHVTFKMFMILGYPWDTMEDFKSWEGMMRRVLALDLTKNVNLRIKWTPFIPQPCTPLRDAKPNYTWDMYQAVERWHALNRRPKREPGFFVENDGIMSHRSHKEQCELTAGDEFILQRYPATKPSKHPQFRRC